MKKSRTYMVRRGKRYLIERKSDGTFGKWISVSGAKTKRTKSSGKVTGIKPAKHYSKVV